MKYVFFAGPAPVQDGGHASHSIAWSWSQAMKEHTALLITRRFRRGIDTDKIKASVGVPTWFCPDFSLLGLRRFSEIFRCFLDTLLLCFFLPRVTQMIRQSGATRIFAFPHTLWMALIDAYLLGLAAGLPTDIYLVDDLAALATLQKKSLRARLSRIVEAYLLPRFAKIYVISKGYAERLKADYKVDAEWLPLVIRVDDVSYEPPPALEEIRYIGFSGSTSELYREALLELRQALLDLNQTGPHRYKIGLCVLGRSPGFPQIFSDPSVVEVFENLPNEKLVERLRNNYANYLPYSFSEELKVLVTTSFSCKTSEYFAAGRPILVYGPAYASVPRHFLENHLPLVGTTQGGLRELILGIEKADTPGLIARYREVIDQFHSPAALRRHLLPAPPHSA